MKSILIEILLFLMLNSYGQVTNGFKLLGAWQYEQIEFDKNANDTMGIRTNLMRSLITFKKDNIVTVAIKQDTGTVVYTSNYTLAVDGSSLTQNGVTAKIIKLTGTELTLNVEGNFIAYLKRSD